MSFLRAAIQGDKGAFSECAAKLLVPTAEIVPTSDPETLFGALQREDVDCAVVPIENVKAGSVFAYYDLLLKFADVRRPNPIKIVKEQTLNIHHNLVCHPEASLSGLAAVCSHANALAQCEQYIDRQKLKRIEHTDTASYLSEIRSKRILDTAAIASRQAAWDYDMRIIDTDIQDREKNYTRFLLLAHSDARPEEDTNVPQFVKMSLAFCIDNESGSLFKAVSVFASRNLDIVRLETRPVFSTQTDWIDFNDKPWDLIYHADVRGRIVDCRNAVNHLKEIVMSRSGRLALAMLGFYPAQSEVDEDGSAKLWRPSSLAF